MTSESSPAESTPQENSYAGMTEAELEKEIKNIRDTIGAIEEQGMIDDYPIDATDREEWSQLYTKMEAAQNALARLKQEEPTDSES